MQIVSTLSLIALLATAECTNTTNSSSIATQYTRTSSATFGYWGNINGSSTAKPESTPTQSNNNGTHNNSTHSSGTNGTGNSNSTHSTIAPHNNGTSTSSPIIPPPTATPSSYDIIAPSGCRGGYQVSDGFAFNLYEIKSSLFNVSSSDIFMNAVLGQSPSKQANGQSFETVKEAAQQLSTDYVAVELSGYFVPGTDVSYKFTSYPSEFSSLQVGSSGQCFTSSSVTSNTNKVDNLGNLLKRSEQVLGLRGFFDNSQTYPIRFVAVFDRTSDFNGFSISTDNGVDLSLNNIKQYQATPFSSVSETASRTASRTTSGTTSDSASRTTSATTSGTTSGDVDAGTSTDTDTDINTRTKTQTNDNTAINTLTKTDINTKTMHASCSSESSQANDAVYSSISPVELQSGTTVAKSTSSESFYTKSANSNAKSSSIASASSSASSSSSGFTNSGSRLSVSSALLALGLIYLI